MSVEHVGVVGAGLVGTSIGMALARTGRKAVLVDAQPERAATAQALGAGRAVPWEGLADCDHVIVAVPPDLIAGMVLRVQRLNLNATVSDVASVKTSVLLDAETLGVDMSRFCPAHPVAGRERGGPTAAVPELFDESVWVCTPTDATSPEALSDVFDLARLCGARPITMTAKDHDHALGVVSHTAQLVASALAAQLPRAGELGPLLAGRGFRDTTRLADSDALLWEQIAMANRAALGESIRTFAFELTALAEALERGDAAGVRRVLDSGREARTLLPTKTGRSPARWTRIGVVLSDRPGELARLFTVAGEAGVNIEDVTIDHATDHPVGMVALFVAEGQAGALEQAVTSAGWHAVPLG